MTHTHTLACAPGAVQAAQLEQRQRGRKQRPPMGGGKRALRFALRCVAQLGAYSMVAVATVASTHSRKVLVERGGRQGCMCVCLQVRLSVYMCMRARACVSVSVGVGVWGRMCGCGCAGCAPFDCRSQVYQSGLPKTCVSAETHVELIGHHFASEHHR